MSDEERKKQKIRKGLRKILKLFLCLEVCSNIHFTTFNLYLKSFSEYMKNKFFYHLHFSTLDDTQFNTFVAT